MARRRRNSSRRRSALPNWAWLLAGLAIGLAAASVVYLRTLPVRPPAHSPSAPPTAPAPRAEKAPAKRAGAAAQAGEDATQYDFYDILPSFEVVIPERDPTPTRNRPSEPVTEPGRYLLQAGSFSTYHDADQRKASLALLGVEAAIQKVTIEDDVFYRVRIGPIDDLDELNRVRKRLSDARIEALMMKAP